MITPYSITGAAWTPVTTAGKYAKAFIDIDGDGAAGKVDIRIFHGESAPNDADLTDSPRLYTPHDNLGFFRMEPDSLDDIFYLRAKNAGGAATVQVDESAGTAKLSGVQDVALQDQTTPAIIFPFNLITNSTTTTADTVMDTYIVSVASTTGIVAKTALVSGTFLVVFSEDTARFYAGRVLEINGLDLTMDRTIDSVLPSGSNVNVTTTEMNVDGSTDPVTFGLRGNIGTESIEIYFDVTRLMIGVLTDTVGDLSEFGDIASLLRGVTVRSRNGENYNIFNWKNNGELATLAYDLAPYSATNPQQGVNGFTCRLTFAGQNKIGVAIRLGPGEDLEVIVQDDLEGLLRFGILAEGHIVD